MAAHTVRGSDGVFVNRIDRSMERGSVHLIMGTRQSSVAFFADLRLSRLFGVESMGGVAAVALVRIRTFSAVEGLRVEYMSGALNPDLRIGVCLSPELLD
jgi:hypothetical protein